MNCYSTLNTASACRRQSARDVLDFPDVAIEHKGTATAEDSATASFSNRDKTGAQEKEDGSQAAVVKGLTSRFSFEAEGTGLEPATPYGAPHFECGC